MDCSTTPSLGLFVNPIKAYKPCQHPAIAFATPWWLSSILGSLRSWRSDACGAGIVTAPTRFCNRCARVPAVLGLDLGQPYNVTRCQSLSRKSGLRPPRRGRCPGYFPASLYRLVGCPRFAWRSYRVLLRVTVLQHRSLLLVTSPIAMSKTASGAQPGLSSALVGPSPLSFV